MDGKRQKQTSELEAVLARHLGRVAAPEELWSRLQSASCIPPVPTSQRLRWGVAFLVTLVMLAGSVRLYRHRESGESAIAQLWAQMPDRFEFRSPQATKMREWVRVHAGLDIPLCAESSGRVQLVSARLVPGANPTAAIAYQVNHHQALLLVSPLPSPSIRDGSHHLWTEEPKGNQHVASWTMQGQSYRLLSAASSDSREACGVCHSHVEQLTALN